ncbi:MAG: segregation/condensation protein A [Microbacteriaceae bacterium]|nr:segregation/condensation protein A [Microbacteriaceae bacterium]MCI1207522.1 segregation/condensation protein A [Microbacteriaceae bacterium]
MAPPEPEARTDQTRFTVDVGVFDGPFDVLLTLITRKQLSLTEISLSQVAAEFVGFVRSLDSRGQLEQSSQFLVIAATLLDLKAAELLPRGEVVDREDVAALEARDLLFARLLQYRAFKEVSAWLQGRMDAEQAHRRRHSAQLAGYRTEAIPLRWTATPEDLLALAVAALAPREIPQISLDHLHAPAVSIREQAAIVVVALRQQGNALFTDLIADTSEPGVIVARFLAILELYREAAVSFEQPAPLGPLRVSWTAQHWTEENLGALGADYEH